MCLSLVFFTSSVHWPTYALQLSWCSEQRAKKFFVDRCWSSLFLPLHGLSWNLWCPQLLVLSSTSRTDAVLVVTQPWKVLTAMVTREAPALTDLRMNSSHISGLSQILSSPEEIFALPYLRSPLLLETISILGWCYILMAILGTGEPYPRLPGLVQESYLIQRRHPQLVPSEYWEGECEQDPLVPTVLRAISSSSLEEPVSPSSPSLPTDFK